MNILSHQQCFRPEVYSICRVKDYEDFKNHLIKIDRLLDDGGLEHKLVNAALARHVSQKQLDPKVFYASATSDRMARYYGHALRCSIARHLTGESYRQFSIRLADSQLFQWFTHINAFNRVKGVSKSALERYEKAFNSEWLGEQIKGWLSGLSDEDSAAGLNAPLDFDVLLTDSSCIKANIHFPVDWVLLRDAARTLLLAIRCIRKQQLCHRMPEPSSLLKRMNKLCIEMTHCRRKKDSKKHRKAILRKMKRLSRVIEAHAKRYHYLLAERWHETNWSEAQVKQVLRRIENVLAKLPQAIEQAHERIIGERQLLSKKKLLSLYDDNADVIVRGKSGAEVEFGQKLLITEQVDGLIVDWEVFDKQAPSDSELLELTLKRCKTHYKNIKIITGDRGFNSKANDKFLAQELLFNATCPRSPDQLRQKLEEPCFAQLQNRRSQTEARVGIIKNVFIGRPLKTRMLDNKRHAVNWCVLSHNLWLLARKLASDELPNLSKAA
jgi:hypothetical protein